MHGAGAIGYIWFGFGLGIGRCSHEELQMMPLALSGAASWPPPFPI